MKKIKALLLTLLSLSVVGAASGCSFDAVKALFDKTDSSTPSANESPSDTGSSDGSTDGSTDGTPGDGDVTPDGPATPVSGDGSDEAPYVIEAGKSYVASNYHSLDEEEMDIWTNNYVIVSNVNGTYTFDLLEDLNEFDVEVQIQGVDIPLDEENDYKQMADGFSFAVSAGKEVKFTVSSASWDTWPATYYDVNFSVSFDADTYEANGSQLAPITIANGETYTEEVSYPNTWYTFTAPSAGYYKFTVNADWANVEYGFRFYDANWNTFLRGAAVAIAEGETITFYTSNDISDSETWETIPTAWTFSFGETLENDPNYDVPPVVGSYDLPFDIDATGDYEITIPATFDGYYANLNGAFQFVVPTGVVVEANYEPFFAGDVIAFSDYDEMWNNQLMLCFHIEDRTATEPLTVTITVEDYVAEEEAPTEGFIEVTTSDTDGFFDLYTFTAPAAGEYTFVVPSALGFYSKASYDAYSTPEVGYLENASGDTVVVTLSEGEEYQFYVGSLIEGDWFINWTMTVGGDDEGDVVSTVLTVGSNSVVLTDENYQDGTTYTFTPDAAGLYTFASGGDVMFQVTHPMGLQMGNHLRPQMSLEAGITYNVLIAGLAPGNYTLTITAPESGEDSSDAIVIDTIPGDYTVVYEGNGQMGLVAYELTTESAGTLVLTFDTADTWVIINTNVQVAYLHEASSFTVELDAANTYEILVGTWSEFAATMNMNVAFTPAA